MRVFLTEPAEQHLDGIREYLQVTSVRFADEMMDRLAERMQQIADFPESGALVLVESRSASDRYSKVSTGSSM